MRLPRSLDAFYLSVPRMAGGDKALDDILGDLDKEIATLKAARPEPAAPAPVADPPVADPTAPAPVADAAAEIAAAQKKLDDDRTALEVLGKRLTGQAGELTAAMDKLKEHGGSRFVGPASDEDVQKFIAQGGSIIKGANGLQFTDPRQLAASAHQGAKALKDSKSVMRFFSSLEALRKGYATDAEREFMLESKALAEATGSAGGYLIPPDWMPNILPLFRGVTVIRRAQPRIVPFSAQMNQVQLSTGATAYYTPENAAITPSQETFAQVTLLTPHNLTGLVPVSTYLLNDSRRTDVPNPISSDAEDTLQQDLSVVMALKEDKNFLMGNPGTETGSPTGLTNIAGIVTNPLTPPTNGFQPTLPQMRQIRNYVRRFSVPNPRWTWFFNPMFLSYLEGLTDSLGRFLADTSLLQVNNNVNDPSASGSIVGAGSGFSGVLDGVPFFCSNQIPVNLSYGSATNSTWLLLVDMNQLVVGLNQDMVVDVSTEASYTPDGGTTWISSFQNNQTLFKSTLRHDINHLYPYTILLQQGVLVS